MRRIKKEGLVDDTDSSWISTSKTIFDDRTTQSDYSLQQLSALGPHASAVSLGEEVVRDAEGGRDDLSIAEKVRQQNLRISARPVIPRHYTKREKSPSPERPGLDSAERVIMSGQGDLLRDLSKEVLIGMITRLTAENDHLKQSAEYEPLPEVPTTWRTIYRIDGGVFLDKPSWSSEEESGRFILRSHAPISSTREYLRRHEEIAFVVFKTYDQVYFDPPAGAEDEGLPDPQPTRESVRLVSEAMMEAMSKFLKGLSHFSDSFPGFDVAAEIGGPYLFWYHFRDCIDESFAALPASCKDLIGLFRSWIEEAQKSEWEYVDTQFGQGLVSPISIKYLIRPGNVLVTRRGTIRAYIAEGWAQYNPLDQGDDQYYITRDELDGRVQPVMMTTSSGLSDDPGDPSSAPAKTSYRWTIESWAWSFDGSFKRARETVILSIESASLHDTVPVASMDAFPLQYAHDDLKQLLRLRGHRLWRCRKPLLVSYSDPNDDGNTIGGDRYMVDVATYHQYRRRKAMDQDKLYSSYQLQDRSDGIDYGKDGNNAAETHAGTLKFDSDDFPECPQLYIFPRTVIAYDLRRKVWTDLEVDSLRDVDWDKKAFESLALDEEAKELIQALVTKQIAASKGTDIIADKGNNLIMLLHGGPGTGKTFTAESIADFAEKPLYRVTCGDIGTNPEQVEKYLESVLHLGLIWDCVVLLDEADVFLEERSQADLARNALVSVFLRVLEYYQGILVLTSNRVGTFDEAFKSRIQLALHYKDLSLPQRRKIWRNFINRLKSLGEGNVDYDDIEDHIEVLEKHEINGRQIRNTINSARQLAQYRRQNMRFSHLEHVINVSGRFETYIREVKSGMSDAARKRIVGDR